MSVRPSRTAALQPRTESANKRAATTQGVPEEGRARVGPSRASVRDPFLYRYSRARALGVAVARLCLSSPHSLHVSAFIPSSQRPACSRTARCRDGATNGQGDSPESRRLRGGVPPHDGRAAPRRAKIQRGTSDQPTWSLEPSFLERQRSARRMPRGDPSITLGLLLVAAPPPPSPRPRPTPSPTTTPHPHPHPATSPHASASGPDHGFAEFALPSRPAQGTHPPIRAPLTPNLVLALETRLPGCPSISCAFFLSTGEIWQGRCQVGIGPDRPEIGVGTATMMTNSHSYGYR